MKALRTLLVGETWALPIGVSVLAVLSVVADHADPRWWQNAAGPLLLVGATVLVLAAVCQSSRR